VEKLVGVDKPTERNKLVLDHYAKLGFTMLRESESETIWELPADAAGPEPAPMKVIATAPSPDGKRTAVSV
jgi:hypothetical protein